MKVDQASLVEARASQTTGTCTSSATSASTPKLSMFKRKAGFVIPKNKLSGSLVPIFHGGKKPGDNDVANKENVKKVQRKSKWGSDLTQDATVRRGRVLAYQTRVEQITQQLKSKNVETVDNQVATWDLDEELSHHINHEKSDHLELERREVIGEILKLNPKYKPPSDYKPLLKEAEVPIPIKEYPGYDFIGLIYGPGNDTHNRLEKETGAKILVYGVKGDRKEKVKLISSDEKENLSAYESLYVLVSADTYDKVDAAVSLIELLVNPISAKPTSVSGDHKNVPSQSNDTTTLNIASSAAVSQGVVQSAWEKPIQNPLQGQFLYGKQWFNPPSGFTPSNPPSPIINNPSILPSFDPSNVPSHFGPRPSMQVLDHSFMPQARPFGQTSSPNIPVPHEPNISIPHLFTGDQPKHPGMLPPFAPPRGSHVVQPNVASMAPPSNNYTMVSLPTFPSQPPTLQVFSTSFNYPISRSVFSPRLPPQVGLSHTSSNLPQNLVTPPSRIPNPNFVNVPSLNPTPPPFTASNPQQNSGSFSFQIHRPPNPNPRPPLQSLLPPQAPPSLINAHNFASQPQMAVFQRSQFNNNQMGQGQAQNLSAATFGRNPNALLSSPRIPQFPNHGPPSPLAPLGQMRPRNYSPVSQMLNSGHPMQIQQNFGASANLRGNFLFPNQYGNNPSFIPGRPSSIPLGGQKLSHPFTSTPVPRPPQKQGGNLGKMTDRENDPEYEDLMASVGVK